MRQTRFRPAFRVCVALVYSADRLILRCHKFTPDPWDDAGDALFSRWKRERCARRGFTGVEMVRSTSSDKYICIFNPNIATFQWRQVATLLLVVPDVVFIQLSCSPLALPVKGIDSGALN